MLVAYYNADAYAYETTELTLVKHLFSKFSDAFWVPFDDNLRQQQIKWISLGIFSFEKGPPRKS